VKSNPSCSIYGSEFRGSGKNYPTITTRIRAHQAKAARVVKQHDELQLDEAGIHYAIGGLIETDERRSAAARAAHAHIERALAAMGDVRILEADHQ